MKDFEVKFQRDPNAKVKKVTIKTVSEQAARAAAERLLRVAGAKRGKVIEVKEIVVAS